MHPFRVLFLGLLLLLSILSKHAGLNEAPFSAQRGGFVGKISSEFGEAPFNVQQGELVGTLDATLWPIARWGCPPMKYAARTHVGSEYYLRHLRTSACGTRARTGPRSWRRFPLRRLGESDNERQSRPHRRFLKKENKRKRKAERRRGSDKECGRRGRKHATGKPIGKPPTLTSIGTIYVYGGGSTRKQQRAASTSQYGSLIKSFCQRTNRKRVQESGDGHCGVRSLWRQFDAATGKKTASINSEHIRSGREKLATALRTHSKSIITVLKQKYGGTGGITSHEIEERAKLHRICDAASVCDSTYYVGGFHAVDLIAWAMETGRAVYMIKKDECMVEVFEPFERAHKHKAQSPQFTCQYVLILLRRSILALCLILSGFLAQPPPQGASFKQGTTPSFCPQISQIISCVLHHQLNGKHPSRYLRGSRPLKGPALRAGPCWLHPS